MKMKNIAIGLAGLIFLSAIGFNIYQYQRNKKLAENTAKDTVTKQESEDVQMNSMTGKDTSENKNLAGIKIGVKDPDTLEEVDRMKLR